MGHTFASIKESLTSVMPIAIIVIVLSVTCVTLDAGVLVLFLFGTILLILGMSFFTVGSGISMEPLITIQLLGLHERSKRAIKIKKLHVEISMIPDDIVFFDEDVNREFGLGSEANGIVFAISTEKAYKI